MTITEILPWLNLLLVPTVGYLFSIERRLTRLEIYREAEAAPANARRTSNP
jgi:hypothetical protein